MSEDWSERDERSRDSGAWWEFLAGLALVLVEHLLVAGLIAGLLAISGGRGTQVESLIFLGMFWALGIGLSQLGYVLPTLAITFLWRRRVAAGVAVGALLTFLLNGACYGAMMGMRFAG